VDALRNEPSLELEHAVHGLAIEPQAVTEARLAPRLLE
jgi:hypothetical protein